jgi:predicted ATPase/class 3 adenylate cyclase
VTRQLPAGTVTFLFTDVEGSTRLLQELGDDYAEVLAEHRRLLRESFARHGGVEVDTQGDAFFVAFAKASDALAAATDGRDSLAVGPIRVRMGLHTGEPVVTEDGYVGLDVHRAARIAAAGHGGQILLSQSTRDLVQANGLRDLGEHRLKDLTAPERIYQLGDREFPPLKSLSRTNLPVQPSALVGRGRELDEIKELLIENRLVTVTGAGGTGKTRLALQIAADVVERYADGVWFVSLAAVRDAALVEPTIAEVLGSPDDLAEFLRGKQLLLLLDNLEHLLPAAASVVAALGAHTLATSRERLNVTGEQEYPLSPLPLGDAAALFTERARRLKPSFQPDAHVGQIARRLDGLPLALELAAARVKVLTSEQIVDRLEHRLGLLTGGAHDAPERQRTLRATIDWSYDLLGQDERRRFARLAVFAGSFDARAAESVCGVDLDELASLVEKSLVRPTEDGRFFLLETIAEYALEQLDDPEAARQVHADYFATLAEAIATGTPHAPEQEAYAVPSREVANLRAGLDWLLQCGDVDAVLRMGTALSWFWLARSHFHDATHWLDAAPLDADSVDTGVRARARYMAGLISFFVLSDVDRAAPLYEASLDLFRDSGDEQWIAAALNRLGDCARLRGDFGQALALYSEALDRFRELEDREGEANGLHLTGEAYRDLGRWDDAKRNLDRAATLLRATGSQEHLGGTLHSLGDLALDRGDHTGALRYYREALELSVELGGKREAAYCVAGIAAVSAELGRAALAARLWGFAEAQERELGFRMLAFERERYERRLASSPGEPSYLEGAALPFDAATAAALDASL